MGTERFFRKYVLANASILETGIAEVNTDDSGIGKGEGDGLDSRLRGNDRGRSGNDSGRSGNDSLVSEKGSNGRYSDRPYGEGGSGERPYKSGKDSEDGADVPWYKKPENWVDSERIMAKEGDVLINIDFALSLIGVAHRDMELASAIYMINLYNKKMKRSREDSDGE